MPTGASLFVWLPDRRTSLQEHRSYVLTLATYADYIPEQEIENPLPEPVARQANTNVVKLFGQ
jgi:hypothetical protein